MKWPKLLSSIFFFFDKYTLSELKLKNKDKILKIMSKIKKYMDENNVYKLNLLKQKIKNKIT